MSPLPHNLTHNLRLLVGCSKLKCESSNGCLCASNSPPDSLSPSAIPQFIVLSNDDAVTALSQVLILNITERHSNGNGCKIPATWFVTAEGSNATLIPRLYARGHELATNGYTLKANPSAETILDGKLWLNQSAGVPLEDIRGFRAPFQLFAPAQRAALASNGFLYDSSITELVGSATSPTEKTRLWPYTFDSGIPQDCTAAGGACSANESYPGLFEVPLYTTYDASGNNLGPMDPATSDWSAAYQRELYVRMNGNRAPLLVSIHASWLSADTAHSDQLNQFFAYALEQDDVWVVTMSQLLAWMANPVPASEYEAPCPTLESRLARLPAKVGTLDTADMCMTPNVGCGTGTWDSINCVCVCSAAADSSVDGYCMADDGSCTARKVFDSDAGAYTCPDVESSADAPAPAPSAAKAAKPAPSPAAAVAAELAALSSGYSFGQAACGHPLLDYSGLSSTGAASAPDAYAVAGKVVDGSCMTCGIAVAESASSAASFTITLPEPIAISAVRLVSNHAATVAVGIRDSTTGETAQCAEDVVLSGSSKVPVLANCSTALVGDGIVVSSASTQLSLCDVYPVSTAAAAPAPAPSEASSTGSVAVAFRVGGGILTVTGSTAPALCAYLVSLSKDEAATCSVAKVVAESAGTNSRRLLSSDSIIDVALILDASDAEVVAAALARGTDVAGQLYSQGISIVPSVETAVLETDTGDETAAAAPAPATDAVAPASVAAPAVAPAAPAPAPSAATEVAADGATEVSSSGKSNTAAIAGAAAGGAAAGLGALGLLAWWIVRRRRAAALDADTGVDPSDVARPPPRGPISPARGVTATVVIGDAGAKGAVDVEGDEAAKEEGKKGGAAIFREESNEGTLKAAMTWMAAPASEPSLASSQTSSQVSRASRGSSRSSASRGPIRPPRFQQQPQPQTWRAP